MLKVILFAATLITRQVLTDTHPKVQSAGQTALQQVNFLIKF